MSDLFPVAHISGSFAENISVTDQSPWLYSIFLQRSRAIYIGETFAAGGLISRLAAHFGPLSLQNESGIEPSDALHGKNGCQQTDTKH